MRRLLPIALWLVAVKEVAGEGKCGYAADQITCAAAEMCRHETGEGKDEPRCDVYCSTVTACNQHATSVRYVADASCKEPYYHENGVCETYGDCDCDCTEQYKGMCDECNDGYTASAYPACGAVCTDEKSCSGHSSSVTWSTGDKCTCVCENQWSGSTCKDCLSPFGGTDCDACLEGRISYPTCTACSKETHCSSHAESVNDDGTRTTCVCKCENHWEGTKCQTCPSPFGGNCNGHAKSVTDDGSRLTCVCTCANKWLGSTCNNCPAPYAGDSCSTCLANYIDYPTCTECTVKDSCSDHATAVVDDGTRSSCKCTCTNKWSGGDCGTCPGRWTGADCDKCSANHITYPSCVQCTSAKHCSGHADTVTDDGMRKSCLCECKNQWQGDTCDVCPTKYGGSDCNDCAAGYVGYPTCTKCTEETHCSDHAKSVTDDGKRKECVCTCRNQWDGPTCNVCDSIYGGSDCNAFEDDSSQSACVCKCKSPWTGPTCSECPSKYNGTACNRCAENRIDYPLCTLCTTTSSCSGHAGSVAADAAGENCVCACRNQWTGSTCDTCEPRFANDCGECAANHTKPFPACASCSIATSCSGHATSVNDDGTRTSCVCKCSNQWTGDSCETCPSKYSGTDCDKCASGGVSYPTCGSCTFAESCSGHAEKVETDASQTKCVCTCENQWEGDKCQTCPTKFGGSDCNTCAVRHIGYPQCTQCSTSKHCSGHADSVTDNGNRTTCVCSCSNQWTSDDCGECPDMFVGADCNKCAADRIEYPKCTQCDSSTHCSGHATQVTDDGTRDHCVCQCENAWSVCNESVHCNGHGSSATDNGNRTSCVCKCKGNWVGDHCGTCPMQFEGANCDSCALGRIGYPTCTRCDEDQHCSGHALSVTDDGDRKLCVCNCSEKWTGSSCNTCEAKYDQNTCDRCADGHVGFPDCRQCSSSDCNGHEANVTSNAAKTECVCNCANQWTGDTCDVCEASKYAGDDCNRCAVGHTNYPLCGDACHVDYNCSGNADSVTFDATGGTCSCMCMGSWSGDACDICDAKYNQVGCDFCADGFIAYPNCTECTNSEHCNDRASTVASKASGDQCMCTGRLRSLRAGADDVSPVQAFVHRQ
eukprot:gene6539-9991_t